MLIAMPTATGPLTAALNALWSDIRSDHPDLPPARVALSSSPTSPAHGQDRWALDEDGVLTGLSVGIDVLSEGATATVTAILHEAAHVLNWRRHIRDVSSRNVYHSERFLRTALEVGLEWPSATDKLPGRGLAVPVMSPPTEARWAADTAALTPLIEEMLPYLAVVEPPRPRPDRLTLVCACDPVRRVRAARSVVDLGPILCGVCGGIFAVQE